MINEEIDQNSFADLGALARLGRQEVLTALSSVRQGRIFDLEVARFPAMPRAGAHPPLQVVTYRSPQGERAERTPEWMAGPNTRQLGFVTELVIGTMHTGTHIDALSHFTMGPNDAWFNGESAIEHLSDFGPMRHDITAMPPIVTRGLMIDIAAARGVEMLPPSYAITVDDCKKALELAGETLRPKDAVMIRTGYMAGWPDPVALARGLGAGVGLDAARWLADQGAVVLGTDNPNFEQNPSPDPEMPRVVHPFLLIERGIPIMELVYLEDLARENIHAFAFVVSPLKIKGGTASMVRPLALI